MLIERTIGAVKYLVDPHKGNSVFLESHVKKELGEKAGNINAVMEYIYKHKSDDRRFPLVCMWELTNACNFNCPFCFIHCADHPVIQTFDEIVSIVNQMLDAGLFMCTLTGGEVLLHPQFDKIYTYLKENGVIVEVYSNLSLMQERHVELFSKYKPYKLEVTLYGHNNSSYYDNTKQTQYGFDTVFSNVRRLKEAGVNVICKTTATKDTIKSIDTIANLCNYHGIPYYFSFSIHSDYYGKDKMEYELTLEDKKRLLLKRVMRNGHFVPEINAKKDVLFCSGSKYGSYISYDLSFRLCHQAYRINGGSVDLKTHSVSEALTIIKKMVEQFKGEKISFCNGCSASQYCKHCFVDEVVSKQTGDNSYMLHKCSEYQQLFQFVQRSFREDE